MNKDHTEYLDQPEQVAQGDILISPFFGEIPLAYKAMIHKLEVTHSVIIDKDEKTIFNSPAEVHILAHSETGHHHVMSVKTVDFYQSANDPFVSYIDVKSPTELRHLRDFDTHKTIVFPIGKYRINRQGEQTPEGWKRVED